MTGSAAGNVRAETAGVTNVPAATPDDAASLAVTRRQLLKAVAAAAVAWKAGPWLVRVSTSFAQIADPLVTPTLEAFADTIIPGEKRSQFDRAIGGADGVSGAGAVQAGAIDFLNYPPTGVAPLLPGFASGLNARATAFAARNAIPLDPTVPPLVSLTFPQRTTLLVELLDGTDPDQVAWFALAALVFLAYHTAAHRPTVDALRDVPPHPGLVEIGFPLPNADGLWRFPEFSYRRVLATRHPGTTGRGSPR